MSNKTNQSQPPAPATPVNLSDAQVNARVLARVRQMSPDDIFRISVASGVHRADGTLTPEYGGPPSGRRLAAVEPRPSYG